MTPTKSVNTRVVTDSFEFGYLCSSSYNLSLAHTFAHAERAFVFHSVIHDMECVENGWTAGSNATLKMDDD